jgi:hypothetical protein
MLTAPPDAPGNQDAGDAIPTDTTGGADSGLVLLPSAGAVEFDTVIAASGLLAVIPSVQRISLGPNRGGQRAHVWVDEYTVHVLIDGELVKTVPSNLSAEDLRDRPKFIVRWLDTSARHPGGVFKGSLQHCWVIRSSVDHAGARLGCPSRAFCVGGR